MDENPDQPEVIETPADEPETPAVEAPEAEADVEVETPDERDQRIAELEEKNKKLYARAKKAEEDAKRPPVQKAETPSGVNLADAAALLKADVHEDDIERVEKYAKAEGVSIKEALKSDELKAILQVRNEKRHTAQAANVSNVRRGPSKKTDEAILSDAKAGKLPESDDDIERLVAAHRQAQRG
jgi:hypothetical protein